MKRLLIGFLLLTSVVCADELPYKWPVLPGYKAETIPFPLDFAPSLPYKGHEELRFAPGFFQPTAPGYFTYSFLWYVEDTHLVTAETLEGDLKVYFDGLMSAVAKPGQKGVPTSVVVREIAPETGSGPCFRAVVDTWDAFTTGQPLRLKMDIYQPPSVEVMQLYHALYFFEASPHLGDESANELLRPVREALTTGKRTESTATPLVGTRWVATQLYGYSLPTPGDDRGDPYIVLASNGTVQGFAGCSTFEGRYLPRNGDQAFDLFDLSVTSELCPNRQLESNFLKALQVADRYEHIDTILYLYHGDAMVAAFRAAPRE